MRTQRRAHNICENTRSELPAVFVIEKSCSYTQHSSFKSRFCECDGCWWWELSLWDTTTSMPSETFPAFPFGTSPPQWQLEGSLLSHGIDNRNAIRMLSQLGAVAPHLVTSYTFTNLDSLTTVPCGGPLTTQCHEQLRRFSSA